MKKAVLFSLLFVLCCIENILARKHCKCYLIYPYDRQTRTWEAARRVCRMKGADLVKIDNAVEDNKITELLKSERRSRRQNGWYIGGIFENGEWRWVSDNTPMDYSRFPYFQDTTRGDRMTVYAGLFVDKTPRRPVQYNWDYLSPRSNNRMGIICEKDFC